MVRALCGVRCGVPPKLVQGMHDVPMRCVMHQISITRWRGPRHTRAHPTGSNRLKPDSTDPAAQAASESWRVKSELVSEEVRHLRDKSRSLLEEKEREVDALRAALRAAGGDESHASVRVFAPFTCQFLRVVFAPINAS